MLSTKEENMDVFEAITQRRSIRAYKNAEVEEEKLKKVLEAARLAPSAANRQEWRFIVVRNHETRARLVDMTYGQSWVGDGDLGYLGKTRWQITI